MTLQTNKKVKSREDETKEGANVREKEEGTRKRKKEVNHVLNKRNMFPDRAIELMIERKGV